MATVQVKSNIHIDTQELLGGVAQLETPEIEHLLSAIGQILAQRKAGSLPNRESQLLQNINHSLPPTTQKRYNNLQEKLLAEQITPPEHQELLALIDEVEEADAVRLSYLLELAQLRQVSLDELLLTLE